MTRAELLQEAARRARSPRQVKPAASARDAHVEEPALLGQRLGATRLARGELALDEQRQEHGIPLETLGPVVGEEVDTPALALGAEACREIGGELLGRAVELLGQPNQSSEIGLAGSLLIAEPFWAGRPAVPPGPRPP